MSQKPYFSVITPSLNMLGYLRICSNSISDQDVDFEHIVVDCLSNDGTQDWLKTRADVLSICEKDQGMYDAINKGIAMSKGEIISYLNCDEQYLPGVLKKVYDYFMLNPNVDILFGNTLFIDPNGSLLAFRKGFVPRWHYIWVSHLYLQSCSMFIRRDVFNSGLFFNTNWKTIGDSEFVVRALRKGFNARHINQYFSTFTLTEYNLGASQLAKSEIKSFREQSPLWLRNSKFIINTLIRFEKLINFSYWEKFPISYSIYTLRNPVVRSSFISKSASPMYPRRISEN